MVLGMKMGMLEKEEVEVHRRSAHDFLTVAGTNGTS
jgi:hypothetical protein